MPETADFRRHPFGQARLVITFDLGIAGTTFGNYFWDGKTSFG